MYENVYAFRTLYEERSRGLLESFRPQSKYMLCDSMQCTLMTNKSKVSLWLRGSGNGGLPLTLPLSLFFPFTLPSSSPCPLSTRVEFHS